MQSLKHNQWLVITVLVSVGLLLALEGWRLNTHARRTPVISDTEPCPSCPACPADTSKAKAAYVALVAKLVSERKLSMISERRLENIIALVTSVLENNVPGDLLECGVWQGGASIMMKSVLRAHGSDKTLWCADSYQGLPPMTAKDVEVDDVKGVGGKQQHMEAAGSYALDTGVERLQANLRYFDMDDGKVIPLVGWFNATLPHAPIKQLAVLRMDGDLYSSTIDILDNMYDKVVPGGYVIIDDYGYWPQCKKAVHDWFDGHGLSSVLLGIKTIDDTGVWFQKPRG